jgi:hypothetical protein
MMFSNELEHCLVLSRQTGWQSRCVSHCEIILRSWNALYFVERLCNTELKDALLIFPQGMKQSLQTGAAHYPLCQSQMEEAVAKGIGSGCCRQVYHEDHSPGDDNRNSLGSIDSDRTEKDKEKKTRM